jgi:hypothetical protein
MPLNNQSPARAGRKVHGGELAPPANGTGRKSETFGV